MYKSQNTKQLKNQRIINEFYLLLKGNIKIIKTLKGTPLMIQRIRRSIVMLKNGDNILQVLKGLGNKDFRLQNESPSLYLYVINLKWARAGAVGYWVVSFCIVFFLFRPLGLCSVFDFLLINKAQNFS